MHQHGQPQIFPNSIPAVMFSPTHSACPYPLKLLCILLYTHNPSYLRIIRKTIQCQIVDIDYGIYPMHSSYQPTTLSHNQFSIHVSILHPILNGPSLLTNLRCGTSSNICSQNPMIPHELFPAYLFHILHAQTTPGDYL